MTQLLALCGESGVVAEEPQIVLDDTQAFRDAVGVGIENPRDRSPGFARGCWGVRLRGGLGGKWGR
jgi:hypothetical protein